MRKQLALFTTVAALAVTPALAQSTQQQDKSQTAPQAQPSQPSTQSPSSPSTTMKDDKSAQSPSATGSDSTSAQSPSATDSDSKSAQSPSATGSKSAGSDAGMTGQQFVNTQTSGQWLASDMIGMEVVGSNNEDIGSVSDLLVDNEGNILAAVVGVGGFLGIGQKNVAITFDALNLTNKDGEPAASLTLTKEELEGAPEFKSAARAKSDAQRQSAPGSSGSKPATPRN